MSPEVTCILLTWNFVEYTKKAIESMYKTKTPFSLIVVDNNSTDGTKEYLGELMNKKEDIKVLYVKDASQGKARNMAIKLSQAPFIVFLDNDIICSENWLDKLLSVIKTDEKIGLVGPVMVSSRPYKGEFNGQCRPGKILTDSITWNTNPKITTSYLMWFCLLIRKSVLDKVTFQDFENIKPTSLDHELSNRIRKAGYKTLIAPEVVVWHYSALTTGKKNKNGKFEDKKEFRYFVTVK